MSGTLQGRRARVDMQKQREQQRASLLDRRDGEAVVDMMGGAHDESASLHRLNAMTSDTINLAVNVLQSLKEQGSILDRAHTKLRDIAASLGMSSSLLRVIERREWGDALIVYGGMLFTLVVLYFVYSWSRG